MKALIYEGPRVMTIRESEKPVPQRSEVLIRVVRAGICGSELGGYLGHNSLRKPPLIMGHEFSGTIEEVGPDVRSFQTGDRVTANPLITCGVCRACTTGSAQLCLQRKLLGAHLPGAFAEYVAVPEKNVYRLDDHVSLDEGAFTEPYACAVHVCRLLGLAPGDRLLIMGAGPIGLFVLQAAQVHGLQDIAVIDINEARLEIAKELKAVTGASLHSLGIGEHAGAFDAAVDAVGLEATRLACMTSIRPGGKVVFTGLHEDKSMLPINHMIRSEIKAFGAFAYSPQDFETALQWISRGRVKLTPWTAFASLEQGGASFEKLIGSPGKIAKILLTISE